ncbi:MAG: hypothetical protein WEB54_02090, partial [Saccharospirillum sp.]
MHFTAPARWPAALNLLVTLAVGALGAVIFSMLSWPLPWMLGSLTSTLVGSLFGFTPHIPMRLFTAM